MRRYREGAAQFGDLDKPALAFLTDFGPGLIDSF